MPYIVSLNGGSSFDDLDAILYTIDIVEGSHPSKLVYIDALKVDWPEDLQPQIFRAFRMIFFTFRYDASKYAVGACYA
jgi:hypothetical protein